MLESARRGGCQQVQVKLGIGEEGYVERSKERRRCRGGKNETDSELKMGLARLKEWSMQMCVEG